MLIGRRYTKLRKVNEQNGTLAPASRPLYLTHLAFISSLIFFFIAGFTILSFSLVLAAPMFGLMVTYLYIRALRVQCVIDEDKTTLTSLSIGRVTVGILSTIFILPWCLIITLGVVSGRVSGIFGGIIKISPFLIIPLILSFVSTCYLLACACKLLKGIQPSMAAPVAQTPPL